MKKLLFYCLLIGGMSMLHTAAQAQFRTLPAAVTDSFKAKYPNAKQVSWSDKFNGFQASFQVDTARIIARFKTDGSWLWSTKKISQAALPAAVQDGFSKSKYATPDWNVTNVVEHWLPGGVTQYSINIEKSSLQRKVLLFSSTGQLLKDDATL